LASRTRECTGSSADGEKTVHREDENGAIGFGFGEPVAGATGRLLRTGDKPFTAKTRRARGGKAGGGFGLAGCVWQQPGSELARL